MICYAIRQISTGYYLPLCNLGSVRGGTHVSPSSTMPPRLFKRPGDAKQCLGWWLKGKFSVGYATDTHGEDYETSKTTPVPGRDVNDFKVIEIPIP